MSVTIPESHHDLLDDPIAVTLVTVMPDGQPQATVVWSKREGNSILISATKGRRKTKNIETNPKVTVMAIDPTNMYRYLEVRGEVKEIVEEGAFELIDELAKLYTGADSYYGDVAPAESKAKEQRVILRVIPNRVVASG